MIAALKTYKAFIFKRSLLSRRNISISAQFLYGADYTLHNVDQTICERLENINNLPVKLSLR